MVYRLIFLPLICVLFFDSEYCVLIVGFITCFDGHKYKVVTPNVHVLFDAYSFVNISGM